MSQENKFHTANIVNNKESAVDYVLVEKKNSVNGWELYDILNEWMFSFNEWMKSMESIHYLLPYDQR